MKTLQQVAIRHMTWEECIQRWPRLVRGCQRAACLNEGEAGCALRDYRDGRKAIMGIQPYDGQCRMELDELFEFGEMMMRWGGGEAVSHFGGPRAVISAAFHNRHMWKDYR